MIRTDVERVQTYLRRLFDTDRIRVVPPPKPGLSVELAVDDEVIGTVHRDDEEGEVSYSLHITILEEELPAAVENRGDADAWTSRSARAVKRHGGAFRPAPLTRRRCLLDLRQGLRPWNPFVGSCEGGANRAIAGSVSAPPHKTQNGSPGAQRLVGSSGATPHLR